MSAAGIIFRAASTGRLLFQLRSGVVADPHLWHIWGGRIEANETPIEAAIREAREEAQWDGHVNEIRLLQVLTEDAWSYTTYLAEVAAEFTPVLNSESCGYAWLPAGIVPGPAHPHLPSIVAAINHQI